MKKFVSTIFFYLTLGWKNIFKYKRRSLQVLIIVVIGALVLVTITGFSVSMMDKFLEEMLENTSHGKIFASGYYDKKELSPLDISN